MIRGRGRQDTMHANFRTGSPADPTSLPCHRTGKVIHRRQGECGRNAGNISQHGGSAAKAHKAFDARCLPGIQQRTTVGECLRLLELCEHHPACQAFWAR